ncbi:MAG: TolC family protein, partial [Alphaproteobacteria bacterium]
MVRIVFLLCALSAVASCASGAPRIEAALPQMPDGWRASGAEDASPPEDWLTGFDDETLTRVAREALAHNNDIGAAAARLKAARASAVRVGAARWPTADLEPGAVYSNSFVETGPGSTVRVDGTTLSLGLQTSWEVDIWGRLTDETRGATADADAAAWELAALRLSIAGAVAQAWFGLIEAHLLTDLAERDLENKERSLRLIFRRYRRGLSSSLD